MDEQGKELVKRRKQAAERGDDLTLGGSKSKQNTNRAMSKEMNERE